jgi:hypothetical protein
VAEAGIGQEEAVKDNLIWSKRSQFIHDLYHLCQHDDENKIVIRDKFSLYLYLFVI